MQPRWTILDNVVDVASVLWTTEAPVVAVSASPRGAFVHQVAQTCPRIMAKSPYLEGQPSLIVAPVPRAAVGQRSQQI